MNDVVLVEKMVGLEDLEDDVFDLVCFEAVGLRLEFLEEGFLDVVEDEEEFTFFAENCPEVNEVAVFELFENFDLPHHGLAHVGVFFLGLLEFLDCHDAAVVLGLGFVDLAIGALADYREDSVVIHLFNFIPQGN